MIKAAADMNPFTTGRDRKLTKTPRRAKPSPSWTAPTRTASRMAMASHSADPSAAWGDTARTASAVISEMSAAGPTESSRQVPNST